MKLEIKSRWTGEAIYACELSAEVAGRSIGVQLGFAVKAAYKAGAVLSDADLRGAALRGADLRGADLSDAALRDADLRGADLRGAALRDADLRGADLRGAALRDADLRGAALRDADLRGADLSDAALRGADLRDAVLSDAALRGADLRDAVLSDADLRGADLSDAALRDADLRGADYLTRCPVSIPNIHQAVYAAASQPDALNMKTWHTCDTTHCRAGWVVHLAGEGGKALEYAMGTPAAASLIYMTSDPNLERMPDFYCNNDAAMADMARLAGIVRESEEAT